MKLLGLVGLDARLSRHNGVHCLVKDRLLLDDELFAGEQSSGVLWLAGAQMHTSLPASARFLDLLHVHEPAGCRCVLLQDVLD